MEDIYKDKILSQDKIMSGNVYIRKMPNSNSELIFGETHYCTVAKFNKLQKRMWKKYFGIEIKDIKGE